MKYSSLWKEIFPPFMPVRIGHTFSSVIEVKMRGNLPPFPNESVKSKSVPLRHAFAKGERKYTS
jgi:hypothetical protein